MSLFNFKNQLLPLSFKILFFCLASFIFLHSAWLAPEITGASKKSPSDMNPLIKEAQKLFWERKTEDALQAYQEILRHDPGDLVAYDGILACYQRMGKLEEALAYFEDHQGIPDRGEKDFILGLYHLRRNQFAEAKNNFEGSLQSFKTWGNHGGAAYSRVYIGDVLVVFGRWNQGKEQYKKAMEIFLETGDRLGQGECFIKIGHILRNLGYTGEAERYFRESLEISREIDNRLREAGALRNLASIRKGFADYVQALKMYRQSLRISEEIGSRWAQGANLNEIGFIYFDLSRYGEALQYFSRALKVNRESDNRYAEGYTLNNMGKAYLELGHADKAFQFFENSLNLRKETGDLFGEASCLSSMGEAHLRLDHETVALEYFEESLRIRREVGQVSGEGGCLNDIGFIYLKRKNSTAAESVFQQSLEIGEYLGRPLIIWQAQYGLARAAEMEGKMDLAMDWYESAIGTIENIRSQLILEEHKMGFFREKVKIYHHMIDLLYSRYEKEQDRSYLNEAFSYMERSRSRAFLDLLAEARAKIRRFADPALLEKEEVILRGMAEIHTRLFMQKCAMNEREELLKRLKEFNRHGKKEESTHLKKRLSTLEQKIISDQELQALEADLSHKELHYERLQEEIKLKSPRYAAIKYPTPYDLEKLKKVLADDKMVVLEYLLCEKRSFLFAITNRQISVHTLPPKKKIEGRIASLLEHFSSESTNLELFFKKAYGLYQTLLEPAEGLLRQDAKLVIIPDGALYGLPFETLLTQKYAKREAVSYVVKKYPMSYIPSASILGSLLEDHHELNQAKKMSLLALGDPIFGEEKAHIPGMNVRRDGGPESKSDDSMIKKSACG